MPDQACAQRHRGLALAGNGATLAVRVRDLIELCRPRHVMKNVLVLLPLALSGFEVGLAPSLLAFLAFSMMAMAVYAINDTLDAFHDMLHPEKRDRPVASGRVSEAAALRLAGLLALGALALAAVALGVEPAMWLVVYLVLNVFYSHIAKELAVIDVIVVASGFAIRPLVGLSVTSLEAALGWMIAPLFLAAACLATGKRLAKLAGARAGERLRMPAFYTRERAAWLVLLLSNVSVLVLASLVSWNWGMLTRNMEIGALALACLGAAGLIAWTQVVYAMLNQTVEPADIFTRDRLTVTVLVGALATVVLERLL